MFWDFLTLRSESTHQVSFLFSGRGTPYGYRHMNGYSSHTLKLVNASGEAVYCKFHVKVYHLSTLHNSVRQGLCFEVLLFQNTHLLTDGRQIVKVKNI